MRLKQEYKDDSSEMVNLQTKARVTTWCRPREGVFKINTDASVVKRGGSSVGVVVRTHSGEAIKVLSRKYQQEFAIDIMEAIACREGLILAKELQLQHIEVETDNQQVVQAFQRKDSNLSYLGRVVDDIRSLCSSFRSCNLRYIPRSANSMAHSFTMVYFKDISSSPDPQHLVILDDESHDIERGTILAVYDLLVGRYAKQWPKLTNRLHLREWSREIPPAMGSKSKMWALEATHHQLSDEPILLPTLGRNIIEGEAKWGDPIQFGGEFHYVKGYWEWTEDILSRCKNKLQAACIYDLVYVSLFTYDCNSNIVKALCEAWCPSTNTLLTSHGELFISLWDLHTLAGLPMTGFLYDEVVSSAKELTGVDEAGLRFLPHSCNRLLHAYHLLQGSAHGDHYSQVSIDD
ncbi:hypothetical protein DH2020_000380 [Rehmannia glutinosa]|uniref:RNase H type-1 domain-containing protein n=1 Tax=Rehmannia glutinosa TaxID=99300 RepID=A0ABR0XWR8_REHGL